MPFSIQKDYSLLNCYEYKNKSLAMSALDFLSAPCRRILGGRNVSVISQTYDHPYDTSRKVAIVFLSVLIAPVAAPIAVISLASLILKAMTLPFIWEKKIVKADTVKAFEVINLFNQAFQNNKHDEAIKIYRNNSAIGNRDDVYNNLYKIINQKVNGNIFNWEELQTLMPLLGTNDAITLIDQAIKLRLGHEHSNESIQTDAAQIRNFVTNALRNSSLENTEACYKRLFENSLQVKPDDKLIIILNKMALADSLANSLKQRRLNNATDNLQRQLADLNDSVSRNTILEKMPAQDGIHYSVILKNPEKMLPISNTLQSIRILSKTTKQIWDLLNENVPASKERWNTIRNVYAHFQNQLPSICSNAEEKAYLQALQETLKARFQFGDAIWESHSADEINKLTEEFKLNTENEIQGIEKLFSNLPTSTTNTYEDKINLVLRFQKKRELCTLVEMIKICLLKDMSQAAVQRFKTAV